MNYDFKKAIEGQGQTIFTPGREFRNPHSLEKILNDYKRWNKMKKIILNGASYPIPVSKDNVSSRSQQSDLIGAIKLENNKSESKTQEDKDFIIKRSN